MLKLYYFLQSKIQSTELKLSAVIQKRINEPYSASIFYFNAVVLNLLLVFWQITIDLVKFIIILSRDPGVSFNIFFKQRELRSCPFSYHDYKNIQQRVRMFSLAGMTAMITVAVVSSIVTNLIFGGKLPSWAATVNFIQNDWSQGAAPGSFASLSGWQKFDSASSSLSFGQNLSLNTVASSTTQTDDTNSSTGFKLTGMATSSTVLPGDGSVHLDYSLSGLVAGYHFNSTSTDFSGNNNALTVTNGAPTVDRVTNGSFEVDTSGWTTALNGGIWLVSSTNYHTLGGASLKLGTSQGGQRPLVSQVVNLQNDATLSYNLSVAGQGVFSAYIDGGLIDSFGVNAGDPGRRSFPITAGQHTILFQNLSVSTGSSNVYIDNVTILDQQAIYTASGKFSQALNIISAQKAAYATPITIGSNWTIASFANFPLVTTGSGLYNVLTQSASAPTDYQILVRKSDGIIGTMVGGVFKPTTYGVNGLSGWHHVAAVGSGTNTQFYIDGVLVGTATGKSTGDIKYIGNDLTGNQPWGGADELLIFNRALSGAELLNIANAPGEYLKASYALNATTTDNTATITTQGQQGGWEYGTFGTTTTQNGASSTGASVQLTAAALGGTSAEGAFNCTSGTCTITSGTHNYTTFTVSAGATTTVSGSGGATIYAAGTVTINGVLSLNGANGIGDTGGGAGGSGGGSSGGSRASGGSGTATITGGGNGGGGIYNAGGGGSGASGGIVNSGNYHGGSNAGGGCGGDTGSTGSSGGGGGIVSIISSNQIVIGSGGVVSANGGNSNVNSASSPTLGAGGGGGLITLKAPIISNSGTISANGGSGTAYYANGANPGGGGGGGVVILYTNSGGTITPTPTVSGGPGGTGGIAGGNGTVFSYTLVTQYQPLGTYTSYIDAGAGGAQYAWNNFSWTETAGSTSNISYKLVSTNTTATPSAATFTASPCTIAAINVGGTFVPSGACATALAGQRYLWYQATLNASSDVLTTPTLDSVSANAVVSTYINSGSYTSGIIDTGTYNANWGNLSWVNSLGQTVSIKVRTSTSSTMTNSSYGAAATVATGTALSTLGARIGDRYIQYIATLSTADPTLSPSLDSVTINYNAYPASGTLISNPYNSGSNANIIGGLKWNELLGSTSTAIKLQLSTAPDSGSGAPGVWSAWYGPTSQLDYYSSANTGTSSMQIYSGFATSTNNQWFRYKVTLESGGAYAPILLGGSGNGVNITYVANAAPQFDASYGTSGVIVYQATTTQASTSKLFIQYKVRDPDTSATTSRPFAVAPSFRYNAGFGWKVASSSLFAAGDLSDQAVDSVGYTLHSATWDIKNQIKADNSNTDVYNLNGVQIEVTVNDGEGAMATAVAQSAGFTVDTKAPDSSTIITNASASPVSATSTLTLYAHEDTVSNLKMRLSINPADYAGFSTAPTPENLALGWLPYATSYSFNSGSSTVYVQFMDQYGNISAMAQGTPASQPTGFMVQDTSNIKYTPSDTRIFVGWEQAASTQPSGASFKQYDIYYINSDNTPNNTNGQNNCSTNAASYTLMPNTFLTAASNNSKVVEPALQSGMASTTAYCYRLTITDAYGNVSPMTAPLKARANGSQDFDEGGGGTGVGLLPPTITIAPVATSITTGGASILWETDILTDASVIYSASSTLVSSGKAPIVGVATMASSTPGHEVILTGLARNTTYYYMVKSTSIFGTTVSSIQYSFQTLNGAGIASSTIASSATNTTAIISWSTGAAPASSYVDYSLNADLSNSFEVGSGNQASSSHAVTLTGLTPGTKYYYFVKSEQDSYPTQQPYLSFTTTQDLTPPTFLDPPAVNPSYNSAQVTWRTNEPASSTIRYATSTANLDLAGQYTEDLTKLSFLNVNHVFGLLGLTPDTDYVVRVTSADASNNLAVSSPVAFHTEIASDTIPPVITPGLPSPIFSTGVNSAQIVWTTDKLASSYVLFSTSSPDFNLTTAKTIGQNDSSLNHAVTLTALAQGQQYYFALKSIDSAKNQTIATSSLFTFTTIAGPGIINATSTPDTNSAIINWQTTDHSNSSTPLLTDAYVTYSSSTDFVQTNEVGSVVSESSHSLVLSNLVDGQVYFYRLRSTDTNGAVTTYPANGAYLTFSTKQDTSLPAVIGRIFTTNIEREQAQLNFVTNKAVITTVRYGTTALEDYTWSSQTPTESPSLNHSFNLNNLVANTAYFFKLLLTDTKGNTNTIATSTVDGISNSTTDFQFKTIDVLDITPPTISSTTPINTTLTTAIISWHTDEPATGYLEYSTSSTFADFEASHLAITNPAFSRDPSVTITGLEQGVDYFYRVQSTDAIGNTSAFKYADDPSQLFYTFKTVEGPSLNNISVTPESITMTSAIIHWDTGATSTNALVSYGNDATLNNVRQQTDETMTPIHDITLTGLNPDTVYYFKVRSADANGAASELFNESTQTFRTAKDITGPVITIDQVNDIYNVLNTSAIVSWTTGEPATSTIYYGTTTDNLIGQVDNKPFNLNLNHQFKLTNLMANTPYFLKLVSSDKYGNQTATTTDNLGQLLTFTTQMTPDNEPPIIYDEHVGDSNVDSLTITWSTKDKNDAPKPATSYLQYATSNTNFDNIAVTVGSETLIPGHSVTLIGLTQGQTYSYRILSADQNKNLATSSIASFTTKAGPVISEVTSTVATSTVTINWQTKNEQGNQLVGNSYVIYDLDPSFVNSQEQGSAMSTSSHKVILTNLAAGVPYYFQVRTNAADGGVTTQSINPDSLVQYTFTTQEDKTAPTITFDPATDLLKTTDNSVSLIWTTDEPARQDFLYGTASGVYQTVTTSPDYVTSHPLTLTNLATSTTYYFQLKATDPSNNASSSQEFSFTTLATLHQDADYQDLRAQLNLTGSSSQTEILNLQQQITDLKIQLSQASGSGQELLNSYKQQIASLEQQLAEAKKASGGGVIVIDKTDKVAPLISAVQSGAVSTSSARISWTTNEKANSFIKLNDGLKATNFGNYDLYTSHFMVLDNLSANTAYTYNVASADASGNLATGVELSFNTTALPATDLATASTTIDTTNPNKEAVLIAAANRAMEIVNSIANTVSLGVLESTLFNQYSSIEKLANSLPAPVMGGEPGVITTATTATITWRTDKDSNSTIALAPDNVYNLNSSKPDPYNRLDGNPNLLTKAHQVVINGLKPSTLYHYQLRSKASIGPEAKSRDFTFKTNQETLEVSNYAVQNATAEKAIFKWITNTETDSQLTYIPYRNNKLAVEEAQTVTDKAMTTVHELTVDKFEGGTIYQVELTGKDTKGNMVSKTIDTFSTSKDDLPPIITQVQTESALSQGKDAKVQTIISWSTNEPTLGQVMYEKGVTIADALTEKTPVESSYGRKHVMVITKFDSGEVYSFRVMATDSAGNTTLSKTFTILTPKQKESVFQLILKNFESTFGWVGQIGQ